MAATSFISTMDKGMESLIFSKFSSFLKIDDSNKDIVFYPERIAQRKIAEKRGEGTVEFISVWRDGIEFDWERQRSTLARRGMTMQYTDSSDRTSIITIKAVPAKISYKFLLWSRDLDWIMHAAEAYMSWIHDTPNLILYYNGVYEMDMYMKFGPIVDKTNYDIYEKGQYFVYEFPITLEGWVLTSITTKTILTIILDLYIREGTRPNYRDTLIDEYIITATP
jgi:hypothetical protein